jgi:hypothetical protein
MCTYSRRSAAAVVVVVVVVGERSTESSPLHVWRRNHLGHPPAIGRSSGGAVPRPSPKQNNAWLAVFCHHFLSTTQGCACCDIENMIRVLLVVVVVWSVGIYGGKETVIGECGQHRTWVACACAKEQTLCWHRLIALL